MFTKLLKGDWEPNLRYPRHSESLHLYRWKQKKKTSSPGSLMSKRGQSAEKSLARCAAVFFRGEDSILSPKEV